jgi:hypothetical protein
MQSEINMFENSLFEYGILSGGLCGWHRPHDEPRVLGEAAMAQSSMLSYVIVLIIRSNRLSFSCSGLVMYLIEARKSTCEGPLGSAS